MKEVFILAIAGLFLIISDHIISDKLGISYGGFGISKQTIVNPVSTDSINSLNRPSRHSYSRFSPNLWYNRSQLITWKTNVIKLYGIIKGILHFFKWIIK